MRDYRTDVAFAVAAWSDEAPWPLSQVKEALLRPAFVLYLGRKSCPLAAPLGPRIVTAADPVTVLRSVPAPDWLHGAPGGIASDPFPGGSPDWTETAPAEPLDRDLWHFRRVRSLAFRSRDEAMSLHLTRAVLDRNASACRPCAPARPT